MKRPTVAATPAPAPAARALRREPANSRSAQRVQDILRVSRDVFSERGYEDTTTTEIAQRLQVSEATVFTYFRGKRELCARVIGDWYDEHIRAIEDGLPREAPLQAQFAFIVRMHLRLFLTHGRGMCALVLSEGRTQHHALNEIVQPLQRRYTAPLMDLLARGQASGEVRRDLPLRLLRSLVLGPMEHVLWELVAAERPTDPDETAEQLLRTLWPMLQGPDGELAALRKLQSDMQALLEASGAQDGRRRPV